MIPPRLIQTWKTADLPPRAGALQDRWVALNPSLTLHLHDDASSRALVAEVVPAHLAAYDAMPFGVMRADVFRYAALYRDGGVYADIDMEPLKPLPQSLFSQGCVVSVEARLTRRRQGELGYATPFQIANCIMAAAPRHPFWGAALEACFALFAAGPTVSRDRIEDITGPRMLTRLFDRGVWPDMVVMPRLMLMPPLQYPQVWPIDRHMVTRHLAHGTWKHESGQPVPFLRKLIERHRLTNPFRTPHPVPAEVFLSRHRRGQ